MDASCVDPPVAMIDADPSLLTEALVRALAERGFDVHLPAPVVPVEVHPHDRCHLFPVPTGPDGDLGGGRLLASVVATRRPLAVAVLDGQDTDDDLSLDDGVRYCMNGWAGGHLLIIASTAGPRRSDPRLPQRARWRSGRRHMFEPGGRQGAATAAPRTSLTLLRVAPGPAHRPPVVAQRAVLPPDHDARGALAVAQAGVAAMFAVPRGAFGSRLVKAGDRGRR